MDKNKPILSKKISVTNAGDKTAVFNSNTKKSYFFGKETADILLNMDGKHSISELSKISKIYTEEQIIRFIDQLEEMDFLELGKKKRISFKSLKFRLGAINGNQLFKPHDLITKILFYIIVYISLPILALGIYLFYHKVGSFSVSLFMQLLQMPLLAHIISFLMIAAIHEFAHAVVARHYEVPVPEIGVMLFLILPYVYTDLSFIKLLKSKWKRILCLFGGIMSNLLLMGLSLCIAYFLEDPMSNMSMYLYEFAVMNFTVIILNLSVFFKLDGYFILQELLDESMLWEKSISSVWRVLKTGIYKLTRIRTLFSKNNMNVSIKKTSSEDQMFLFVYGLMCIGFLPLLMISFLLGIYQALF